ncbi:hypothetical protein [Caenimonas aquaedulcis]|uniref:Uncharacterized protein n=1 Tax=Caenimonas aquaedulcis TaxID=2793270 RepID=A0A931H3I3_9BURK|nr:hypothetical protein [Caenimonas aquaedulcis]
MSIFKKTAAALALLACAGLQAQTLAPAYTYSGLTWSFSTTAAGISQCSTLILDATGDVYNSDSYVVHGQLACPALGGNYASSGTAYFDSVGKFHMTTSLSVTYQMVCDNLSGATLSGSCPIYNNLGAQVGTAFISFL